MSNRPRRANFRGQVAARAAEPRDMPLSKVLLVDDEPDIRRIAHLSLHRVGKLQVVLATSGAEALDLAPRELPDVVLLDVMMPELDGPSTFQRLRSNPATAGIPV